MKKTEEYVSYKMYNRSYKSHLLVTGTFVDLFMYSMQECDFLKSDSQISR